MRRSSVEKYERRAAQVRRLAHVEHPAVTIAKEVDAGQPGQLGGEGQLRRRRVRAHGREREEIVEAEHAEGRSPFEERAAPRPSRPRRRTRGAPARRSCGSDAPACAAGGSESRHERVDERARRCRRGDEAVARNRARGVRRRGTRSRSGCCARRSPRRARTRETPASTSAMRGAGSTIASVMPVSTVIIGGIGTPGFTNVSNVPSSSPPRSRSAPISVIASVRATRPSSRGRRPRT